MKQAERDRLVALKKAKKRLITQKQAAEELGTRARLRFIGTPKLTCTLAWPG